MNVHHVAIATADPEKLATFYEDILGMERERLWLLDQGGVRSVWLKMGTARLMIEKCDDDGGDFSQSDFSRPDFSHKTPGFHLLAFSIAQSERASWLAKLGARVESSTEFTLYLRDPDGNRIGLSHFT